MRFLLALFAPLTVFISIGRPFAALFCLLLEVTVIGWIPATLWALYALGQYRTDQKIRKAQINPADRHA